MIDVLSVKYNQINHGNIRNNNNNEAILEEYNLNQMEIPQFFILIMIVLKKYCRNNHIDNEKYNDLARTLSMKKIYQYLQHASFTKFRKRNIRREIFRK